jgi:uncharacterized protein involved in exopolysaccharide biosynthesis
MNEQNVTATVRDIVLAVFRQQRVILGIYAAVVLTAILGIFVATPLYRTSSKVLLTTDRTDISTSADRPTEIMRTNQVTDGEVASQLEIVSNRELIRTVLDEMQTPMDDDGVSHPVRDLLTFPFALLRGGYRRLHDLQDVEGDDPRYWQIRSLQERLYVGRVGLSNILEVGVVTPDPMWGRDFVDRLVKAYVEHHAKMRQVQEAEDFFTEQSQLLKKKLSDSEAALRDLRERAGSLAGQTQEVHTRLNEFTADLARTRILRAEQEQKVRYLEGLQASAAKRGRIATPQLLELEAKRADLAGRYREDSERVRELDNQIARLRAAIAQYDTVATNGDQNGAGGETSLVGARTLLVALTAKEAALEKQNEEYRKQAEMLDGQSFDLSRLERQVKLDEEAYVSYVRTAEQSRLANALEKSKILRLSILEPASVPLEPFSPKKGRIMAFALLGGLVIAAGIGIARDRFDGAVKGADDLQRHANLEVLAVLPGRN